jgi:hypothetical protein
MNKNVIRRSQYAKKWHYRPNAEDLCE